MFQKQFFKWIGLKEKLHFKQHKPPHVSKGEIWWASIGENVGSEINGKSHLFSRPVIIYRKLSHGFYLVIPTTSQLKAGSWYINFKHHGKDMIACLHQIRTIDYRRLYSKLGRLDDNDFDHVRNGFMNLYIK